MNKIKKALVAASTAIITISTIGMTAFADVTPSTNSSIVLQSSKSISGHELEIPVSMYTDNQCNCFDIVLEYDSRLDFSSVEGVNSYCEFEEDGKKYVALIGFSATPYQDGEPVALLKLDIPTEAKTDNYTVRIDRISNFSTAQEEITSYIIQDAIVEITNNSEVPDTVRFIDNTKGDIGLKGDANLDGITNIRDAAFIAKLCAGRKINTLSALSQKLGDVTGDNQVDIRDAAKIARYIAKGRKTWDF